MFAWLLISRWFGSREGEKYHSPELTVPAEKDKDLPLRVPPCLSRLVGTVPEASHIS